MDPKTALGLAANTLPLMISAPWGARLGKMAGTLAASWDRVIKDESPIADFLTEVLPIVQKHWPRVGPAINDLLPIIAEEVKEAES
jgi:phage-related minor tail protein